MNTQPGKLNIVVALPCEARLFLDNYRLSKLENSSAYSIYANSERNIHLIVSGLGKIKSAAALSYLHAYSGAGPHTCYLNAGIAGSLDRSLGELFLAHKIIEAGTPRVFYPLPILIEYLPSLPVLTVEQPLAEYPDGQLVEMEAAGFHQAALNFVTQEQMQTLKIVSDNAESSLLTVRAEQVIALFRQNASAIQKIVDQLLSFSAAESLYSMTSPYFADITNRFHFTTYQRHQLRELLRRWQVNFPEDSPLTTCAAAKTAQTVLALLERQQCK